MSWSKPILLFILTMLAISCHRGDNDPNFTLLTRKQRLEGDWKVTAYNYSKNDTIANLEGDSLKFTFPDSSERTMAFSLAYYFGSDGAYTEKELKTLVSDSTTTTVETLVSGNWEFTGGNNSPTKSKLALFEKDWQQTTGISGSNIKAYSTSGQAFPTVFDIKELRKDKVVLTQKIIRSDPFTSDTTEVNITLEPK